MTILEDFYAGDLIEKVVELNSSLENQLSATGYTVEIESIRAELRSNGETTERLTIAFLALQLVKLVLFAGLSSLYLLLVREQMK